MPEFVIFNQQTSVDSGEKLIRLFSLAKKSINRFRIFNYEKNSHFDYVASRREVDLLLDLCHQSINGNLVDAIVEELINLLTFLGKISSSLDNDPDFRESLKNGNSLTYNYFYLAIDVWFKTYQIFRDLSNESSSHKDFSLLLAQVIIYDLVSLFFLPLKLTASKESLLLTSPIVYDTHRELIIQLVKDVDSQIVTNDHPFWFIVNPIISSLMEKTQQPGESENFIFTITKTFNFVDINQDPYLATLWFAGFVLEMLKNSSFIPSNKQSVCNSAILSKAVALIVKNLEVLPQSSARSILEISIQLVIKIIKNCDPCIDLLLPYMEFFRKESIQDQSSSSTSKAFPSTSYAWSRKIQIITESSSLPESNEKSFELYLRLLSRNVDKICQSLDRNCISCFQKVKGRLSSQILQPKKIEKMDAYNLYKTCSTFIVLKCSSKNCFPEFSEKLEFLAKIFYPKVNTDSNFCDKITIIVRAFFCLIHLQDNNQDTKNFINRTSSIFERICANLGPIDPHTSDPRQGMVTDFVVSYIEELTSLIEMKGESMGCYELVPEKSQILLSKLTDRELQAFIKTIADFVKAVRECLLNSLDDQLHHNFKTLINNLLARFLPYIKSQFANRNSQFNLASFCVDLTLLCLLKEPGKISFNEYKENFIFFSCSKNGGNQSEQYADMMLRCDLNILQEQLKFLFPDLLTRYMLSDANGQAVVISVLIKLISHLKSKDATSTEEYVKTRLKEFISQELFRKSTAKIFKVLSSCITLLPSTKSDLVSHIAHQIHLIERENPVGTMETLRQEFSKFFHS